MGIGEIKTQILGLLGQGDDQHHLAAASIPFTYKQPLIDVEKMRQCADSYREIEKVGTQVTIFAALRLGGGAASVVCGYFGFDSLIEGDVLKGLGLIGVSVAAEQLFLHAHRAYQEGARHEELLTKLYNLTCVEPLVPQPAPIKASETQHEMVGVSAEALAHRHSAWALFERDVNHNIDSGVYYARKHPGKAAVGAVAGVIVGAFLVAQPEFAPFLAL